VFRRKAADHLPRHLLYRMIAYRLQAERLGDLDRDTQRFLDQVATGTRNGGELPVKGDYRHGLQPGTVLVREWDGKPQRVLVLDQGFAWNGATYRSLTEIAFAMTGTGGRALASSEFALARREEAQDTVFNRTLPIAVSCRFIARVAWTRHGARRVENLPRP
jgi:hypothetical protein